MMIKNRKAWTRVIEATITVLAVVAVMTAITLTQSSSNENIESPFSLQQILSELAHDSTLRNKILKNTQTQAELDSFVTRFIDSRTYDFSIQVCANTGDICSNVELISNSDSNVYAAERIISADIDDIGPKKIKLYAWKK